MLRDGMEEQIYQSPRDYDLEHSRPEPDIPFYCALVREWRPARVLELACGNGRVSVPLAAELQAWGGELTGLDSSLEMLEHGRAKAASKVPGGSSITWVQGDMRQWVAGKPFDLVFCPCASMSHLVDLQDQIAAWKTTWNNLAPGGRFVVAEQMANLPVLAESQHLPARAVVEIDSDTWRQGSAGCERLVRYRATRYYAHEQLAAVHFLYDKLKEDTAVTRRFLSDYDCHVFYPRELQLLFLHAGFEVESIWGGYDRSPLEERSREMVVVGRKPGGGGLQGSRPVHPSVPA